MPDAATPVPKPAPPASRNRQRRRAEQQRSQDTRVALMATARRLFGTNGYHPTSTEELVASAEVTRGALYHHFRNKEDLFEAVCREVALETAADAASNTSAMHGQTSQRAMAALHIYLELLVTRRDTQRILLIDGPAVLGWERWRAIRADFEFAGWVRTLSLLSGQGRMTATLIEPLAQIIMAAVNEAILAVAHAADPDRTLGEMTEALTFLFDRLTQGAG